MTAGSAVKHTTDCAMELARTSSDCTDAQADVRLRYLHMPEDSFAWHGLKVSDFHARLMFSLYEYTWYIFRHFFYKGDKLCTKLLLKGVSSKRKEFALKGRKFFPFRVDSFTNGSQNNFDKVVFLISVSH